MSSSRCVVESCSNVVGASDTSFFRFPKDTKRLAIWAEIFKIDPKKHNSNVKICGNHFVSDMLNDSRNRLHYHAYPTLGLSLDPECTPALDPVSSAVQFKEEAITSTTIEVRTQHSQILSAQTPSELLPTYIQNTNMDVENCEIDIYIKQEPDDEYILSDQTFPNDVETVFIKEEMIEYEYNLPNGDNGFENLTENFLNKPVGDNINSLQTKQKQKLPLECEICHKTFSRRSSLALHVKVHEVDPVIYECNICSKRYKFATSYRRHLISHRTDKLHACIACYMTFTEMNDYVQHIESHTFQRFQCEFCDKQYRYKGDFKIHMRSHDPPKENWRKWHQCEICKKKYRNTRTFEEHVDTHKQKKVMKTFQCKNCERTFTSQAYLKQHRKQRSCDDPVSLIILRSSSTINT